VAQHARHESPVSTTAAADADAYAPTCKRMISG
jgi:hypothetical protein